MSTEDLTSPLISDSTVNLVVNPEIDATPSGTNVDAIGSTATPVGRYQDRPRTRRTNCVHSAMVPLLIVWAHICGHGN